MRYVAAEVTSRENAMALPKHPVSPLPFSMLPATLLGSISEIDLDAANNGDRGVAERWLNGITWMPEENFALFTNSVDVCNRIDFAATPRVCDAWQSQRAFSVYNALKAASLEFTPQDMEDLLLARINRKVSAAFATELISGGISGDRSLSSVAHAPTKRAFNSAAAPIWYVLAMLEDELARVLRNNQGTIHLPPGLLGQACETYEVEKAADGHFYTPLGNLVIADAGYVSAKQPAGGGGVAGILNDWVYASGPVRYAKTEARVVDGGNVGSTMTTYTGREDVRSADYTGFRTHNDMTRYADIYGVLQFDTAPVTAALASYEQTDIV